jgi:hypothetical protein
MHRAAAKEACQPIVKLSKADRHEQNRTHVLGGHGKGLVHRIGRDDVRGL